MASLISTAEKNTLNGILRDVHDTFSRDIAIIKEAQKTVSTPSSSFNSVYGTAGATTSIVNVTQSGTFKARVKYFNQEEQYFSSETDVDSQLKIKLPAGTVRIKVSGDAHEYLKDAKRIQLDNRRFTIDGDSRPHGLFDAQFYTYYLKPIDE